MFSESSEHSKETLEQALLFSKGACSSIRGGFGEPVAQIRGQSEQVFQDEVGQAKRLFQGGVDDLGNGLVGRAAFAKTPADQRTPSGNLGKGDEGIGADIVG